MVCRLCCLLMMCLRTLILFRPDCRYLIDFFLIFGRIFLWLYHVELSLHSIVWSLEDSLDLHCLSMEIELFLGWSGYTVCGEPAGWQWPLPAVFHNVPCGCCFSVFVATSPCSYHLFTLPRPNTALVINVESRFLKLKILCGELCGLINSALLQLYLKYCPLINSCFQCWPSVWSEIPVMDFTSIYILMVYFRDGINYCFGIATINTLMTMMRQDCESRLPFLNPILMTSYITFLLFIILGWPPNTQLKAYEHKESFDI